MYLGNLLILAGVALASNSWICLAVAMAIGLLVYTSIVATEENFLRGKFAQAYDAYARDVPRWGVKLPGLGATLRDGEFHWRRLLMKEYGTTAAWVAISVVGWVVSALRMEAAATGTCA